VIWLQFKPHAGWDEHKRACLGSSCGFFLRSELRWEFANIAAAVVLLSIALAAIAFFCFRPRTGDLTLIYFGLFTFLVLDFQ
jgi:hypothetical protein